MVVAISNRAAALSERIEMSAFEKLNILIADDNEIERGLAMAYADALGWEATAVANGEIALAAAKVEKFDLLLFDLDMPGLRGDDLADRIRADHGPNQETPVLIWTASDPAKTRQISHGRLATTVAAKPLPFREFESLTTRLCRSAPSGMGVVPA